MKGWFHCAHCTSRVMPNGAGTFDHPVWRETCPYRGQTIDASRVKDDRGRRLELISPPPTPAPLPLDSPVFDPLFNTPQVKS